jgi:hypothetical protein
VVLTLSEQVPSVPVPVQVSVTTAATRVCSAGQDASETGVWVQPVAVSHSAIVTPAVPQVTGVQVPELDSQVVASVEAPETGV